MSIVAGAGSDLKVTQIPITNPFRAKGDIPEIVVVEIQGHIEHTIKENFSSMQLGNMQKGEKEGTYELYNGKY